MSKKFIEQYPGKLHKALNMTHEYVVDLLADMNKSTYSKEFGEFFEDYVIKGKALKVCRYSSSAWAADLFGTAMVRHEEMKQHSRSEKESKGFDIYKWAKKYNADYYDMHTGYTYHVQEYNLAVSRGVVPEGIKVSYDGEFIGIARK